MSTRSRQRRIAVRTRTASQPMPPAECQAVERLLARLVARAWATDHPELFCPQPKPSSCEAAGSFVDPDPADRT